MTYAGYKPNETASLGAITATGIDAITKINLEREKLDAEKKIKQDELNYKAALEAQKEAAKKKDEEDKSLEATKAKFRENTGKTESSINLLQKGGENMTNFLGVHPEKEFQNALTIGWNGLRQTQANIDGYSEALAKNTNPSMQDAFVFGRNVEKLKSNKLEPIAQLTPDGKSAQLVLKDMENGQITTLEGYDMSGQKVNNTMPDLYGVNGTFNSIVTQIGEIPNVEGRTTTTDVKNQLNYDDQVKQAKNMFFADTEKLGDRYYLASQKLGKTPIYYLEGDDQKELAAKAGVLEGNADFIKMVIKNGVGIAELTQSQKDKLGAHIESEIASRVNVKIVTKAEPSVTKVSVTNYVKDKTLQGAGEIYNGIFNNDQHYIELFKESAQKHGDMLSGYQHKFPSEDPKIKDDVLTPVFEYKDGVIKYLYKNKEGVVEKKKIYVKKLGKVKAAQRLAADLSPETVKDMAEAGALTSQME